MHFLDTSQLEDPVKPLLRQLLCPLGLPHVKQLGINCDALDSQVIRVK